MKKLLLPFLLFYITHVNAQVTNFCFSPAVTNGSSSTPLSICNADFNNDGFIDLATANYNANNTCVLLGNGSSSFNPGNTYATGTGPQSIATADFNGDGFKDLVTANYNGNNFSLLLGSGSGTFGPATNFGMGGSSNPTGIVTADFNGDGFADVVTCNETSNNIAIRLGTGTGGFGTFSTTAVGNTPESVTCSDFNGDGKKDLAVACSGANFVAVLLGNGSGSFSASTTYNVGSNPYSVTSADFNGDSFMDLAIANQGSNNLSILLGTGTGSFGAALMIGNGGGSPQALISADFNLDTKADLAVVTNGCNTAVIKGNGDGTFGTPSNFAVACSPVSLTSADFNNDGKADIATANGSAGNSVSVLLNNIPTVNITGNNSICIGNSTTLVASGSGSYTWSPSGSISTLGSGINSMTVSATPTITTTYNVSGANSGCSVSTPTTAVTVTVNPIPAITFLYYDSLGNPIGAPATCAPGQKMELLAQGAFSYTWSNGGTSYFTYVSPLATSVYTVTGESFYGCIGTNTVSVNVGGPISVNSASICPGGVATLTGSGAATFSWSTGVTAPSITVSPSSTTSYTATSVIGSCTNTAVSTVTVGSIPVITITSSSPTVCPGVTTTLTASNANTYTWSTGVHTNTTTVSSGNAKTYTVNGTSVDGCISATYSFTQYIYSVTPVQVNSSVICAGSSTVLTGINASTYTWNTSANTNAISVSPANTSTYTVDGTDGNGCVTSAQSIVTVNPLPTATVNANAAAICLGNTATLTAVGSGMAPLSYSWSGGIINGASFTPTATAVYTSTVTDVNNCSVTNTISIGVNPLPTVTASSATVCGGTPTILTAGGTATSYSWSTGANTATISVSAAITTTYTATGTDVNNCSNTALGVVNIPVNAMPYICMITADSLALNNIIYWDRTLYPQADSFIVYRYDVFATTYFKLGAVKKDSSQFTDIERTIGNSGSNNGNPQYGSWRYKLAVRDTCGNISAKSPYHESVFVQENFQNFSWNAYVIEAGQSNPTTGYSFQRDDLNTGTWNVLINTAVTSATDPNYASFPNANWRVEALGFNCTPTMFRGNNSTMSAIIRSKSNITNNRSTKINQLANASNFGMYPNPNTGIFSIETNQKLHLQVFTIAGELVLSRNLESGKTTIDASTLPAGIYNINLNSNTGVINNRLVIVK